MCKGLPAEPISLRTMFALKQEVHPDISALLGLLPEPKENVIVLLVTVHPMAYYLGVEEVGGGWHVVESFELGTDGACGADTHPHTAANRRLHREAVKTVKEWADTYYEGESLAILKREWSNVDV